MGRAIYLHGLASSPDSKKVAWLRPRFAAAGWRLDGPDLNVPTFEGMRVSCQVQAVASAVEESPEIRPLLIGSSLGALSTLVYASRNPDRVGKIVLLAPALDFVATRLARLAGSTAAQWAERGYVHITHYDGVMRKLGHQLATDAAQFDFLGLELPNPVLLLHGEDDGVVSYAGSVLWASTRPAVRLQGIPGGDHSLLAKMDIIWEAISTFAGISPTPAT